MAKNESLTPLESEFLHRLHAFPEEATEGFVIQATEKRKKVLDLHRGLTYELYDLASLTKIIFTVHELMRLFDEKLFRLSDKLNLYLPWLKSEATIQQVLSHSAGFEWWRSFFKDIKLEYSPELRRIQLKSLLQNPAPVSPAEAVKTSEQNNLSTKAVYSDIDFLLLGFLIEELRNRPLEDCWMQLKALGNHGDMHFITGPTKKNKYAPTENCQWRGRQIQGEVHDENTSALGGVSSHAGLFGRADDVTGWALALMSKLKKNKGSFGVSQATLKLFTKRAIPNQQGDWALGFMMPTPGSASCGEFYSASSFGHTGFTGTSLWMDPETDRITTLLSNRIYPTRENKIFVTQRANIHNWIWSPTEKETHD